MKWAGLHFANVANLVRQIVFLDLLLHHFVRRRYILFNFFSQDLTIFIISLTCYVFVSFINTVVRNLKIGLVSN